MKESLERARMGRLQFHRLYPYLKDQRHNSSQFASHCQSGYQGLSSCCLRRHWLQGAGPANSQQAEMALAGQVEQRPKEALPASRTTGFPPFSILAETIAGQIAGLESGIQG